MQKRKFLALLSFFIITTIAANAQFDYFTVTIKNVKTGRYLDVFEYKKENESPVKLWDYTGADNQRWRVKPATNGPVFLTGVQSSKCLDANALMLKDNGTNVQIYECHGGLNQQWSLVPAPTQGAYIIYNVAAGTKMCLDADAPTSGANGTRVQLWDCHMGLNQQWEIKTIR